ncbi:MAG: hypothetical protein ABI855_00085 [Bacteroidota bacterium]
MKKKERKTLETKIHAALIQALKEEKDLLTGKIEKVIKKAVRQLSKKLSKKKKPDAKKKAIKKTSKKTSASASKKANPTNHKSSPHPTTEGTNFNS